MTATPSRWCAVVAGLIGLVVLIGWWARVPALTSFVTGFVTMKPNTALGLVLGGTALAALSDPPDVMRADARRMMGVAAALACALVGLLTLGEYALGTGAGIDQWLAHVTGPDALTPFPGRMAAATALTFLTLGGGLSLLDATSPALASLSQWLLATGIAVPLSVLVGYLYRVVPVSGVGQGLQMALHTVVGSLLLGTGGLLARPARGFVRTLSSREPGGLLARRLGPATIGIPVLLGVCRLVAERRGWVDVAGGGAAVTTGTMLLLAWLIWRTASELNQTDSARLDSDRQRRDAEAAQRIAEGATTEKSQFMAAMSHELRTPLNAIIGYTDLLEAGIYGGTAPGQAEALRRIRRSSRHLLRLVEQVLSLSRLGVVGETALDIEPVPVASLFEGIEVLLRPQCADKELLLDVQPCDAELVVLADRARVEEVLGNLCTNAITFTGRGGRVAASALRVERQHMVVLRISDTGPGIPPHKHESIFEPFVQGESGHTRRTDGAGLGLAISRELARAMGGDVVLERSDATGSTFSVWLPDATGGED